MFGYDIYRGTPRRLSDDKPKSNIKYQTDNDTEDFADWKCL